MQPQIKAWESTMKCEVCKIERTYSLLNYPVDMIRLFCDHSLCEKCFANEVKPAIESPKYKSQQDVKCPNCKKPINYFIVEANIDNEELFKKFSDGIFNSFSGDAPPEEPLKQNKKEEEKINRNNEKDFEGNSEKYIEQNFKKCPVCKTPIEKKGGCNVIRCESLRCNKKTAFCYLCGDLLNFEKEKTHYFQANQYGKCINKPKINAEEAKE